MKAFIPQIDFTSVFLFLGVLQSILLGCILIVKGNKDNSFGMGGILLIIIGFLCLDVFFEHSGLILNIIYLYNFTQPLLFLIGPICYYWFYQSLRLKKPRRWTLHLIPFFVYLIYYFNFYLQPDCFKKAAYSWNRWPELGRETVVLQFSPDPLGISEYFVIIGALSLTIYWLLSCRTAYSTIRGPELGMRKHFVVVVLAIYALLILLYLLSRYFFARDLGDFLPILFLNGIVYLTSVILITRSEIFRRNPFKEKRKYNKSALSKDLCGSIRSKVIKVIEEDKIFTQNDLSLVQMADTIGVKRHYLSQVINESFGKSFYEFLSDYRVKEACRLLIHPEVNTWTVERIAYHVGYNSKSAFIKAFKKKTGKTITAYRKDVFSS